ncbi:MAG: DUF4254 domain-containing protein [Planctomycetota bacterium]|nr:DUF4254 domain-containing protein [Planctomycetota bacterium]
MGLTQPLPPEANIDKLAATLAKWQHRWTGEWHQSAERPRPAAPLARVVQEQHIRNFDLWHEEDKARAPNADDRTIAEVKRRIDKLNQSRNDLIEQLDDYFFRMIVQRSSPDASGKPWNSETPGSCIDRLSILSLKVFHMNEQAERADADEAHRERCRVRAGVLTQQREDLATAMQQLLDDLMAGRKQMKLYRQFKMYNDPSLNPEIYGAKKT